MFMFGAEMKKANVEFHQVQLELSFHLNYLILDFKENQLNKLTVAVSTLALSHQTVIFIFLDKIQMDNLVWVKLDMENQLQISQLEYLRYTKKFKWFLVVLDILSYSHPEDTYTEWALIQSMKWVQVTRAIQELQISIHLLN